MRVTAALVGAPNCGKTTLFNRLTGGSGRVGNYPGITVETRSAEVAAKFCAGVSVTLLDLPGIYSLGGNTPEQRLTREQLTAARPDVIINLCDGSNPERALALTCELRELGIPMVVALGMADEAERAGLKYDLPALGAMLGCAVVRVCAPRGEGLRELVAAAANVPRGTSVLGEAPGEDPRGNLSKSLSDGEYVERAAARSREAERIVRAAVRRSPPRPTLSDRIDAVLLGRFTALPVFFVIVAAMFFVTFGRLGNFLTRCIEWFVFNCAAPGLDALLAAAEVSGLTRSLVVDGILGGVGGVLAFLPQIALLFFCLGLLEDSGYMARAAVLADRPLRAVGLSGASFLPMFMGFGCTVAALLATRTISSRRERIKVCMTAPFISCTARWAVYAVVISAFFAQHRRVAAAGIYALGVFVTAAVSALIGGSGEDDGGFLLELPPYRLPRLSNIARRLRERVWEFLVRAGTLIFIMSVVVWALSRFGAGFHAAEPQESFLAALGRAIAPIFAPLGFGGWREAAALLSGLAAKEGVVSTLAVLYAPLSPAEALAAALDPAGACAFAAFCALYTPCVSALTAMARELGSMKLTVFALAMQLAVAYAVAAAVHLAAVILM